MYSKKKNIKILFFIIIFGLLYIVISSYTQIYIPCLFHKITGLYCPGCGITRLIQSLLKLQFKKAFWYNPLVFCLLPFIVLYIINNIRECYNKNRIFSDRARKIFWNITLVITIIFGIIRNIPMFSFLTP